MTDIVLAFMLVLTAGITAAVGIYSLRYREVPTALVFTLINFAVAAWVFCWALDLVLPTQAYRIIASEFRLAFSSLVAISELALVLSFTGRHAWLEPRRFIPLTVVPVVSSLLGFTSTLHPLYRTDYRLVHDGFRTILVAHPGPVFVVQQGYQLALFLVAWVLLARTLKNGAPLYIRQTSLLLLGIMLPGMADMAYRFGGVALFGVNPAAFAAFFGVCCTAWALFRYRMFDVVPVARDLLVESMQDGVVVLDVQGRFVDLNPAACRLLNLSRHVIGRSAEMLLATYPQLTGAMQIDSEAQFTLSVEEPAPLILDARLTPLKDRGGAISGHLLLLQDMTTRRRDEESLRQSERRYRLLAEYMNDVVWTLDPEKMRLLYVSPSVEQLRGYRVSEIVAQPYGAFLDPAACEQLQRLVRNRVEQFSAQQEEVLIYLDEVRLPCRNGSTVWAEEVTRYFQNKDTGRVELHGVTRDITERKRAEEALRKSREQLDLAVEASGIGLWDWKIQLNELEFNDRMSEMTGYAQHEFSRITVGTFARLCHPEDLQRSKALMKEHFAGESPHYECELRLRHKDGHWVWFFLRGRVTERDLQGLPVRMNGTQQDITLRKLAEVKILESEVRARALAEENSLERKKLEVMLENLEQSVLLLDAEDRILWFNPAAVALHGFSTKGEIVQSTHAFYSLLESRRADGTPLPPEERPDIQAFQGNIVTNLELVVRRRDIGKEWIGSYNAIPIRDQEGQIIQVLLTISDITERKKADEELHRARDAAEEASRAKSLFLANMSHEIRTPLNAILGFTQVMSRDAGLTATHRDQLTTIQRSGEHLLTVINEILDMSKIEAGRMTLRLQPFDLRGFIGGVDELFRKRADDQGLVLVVECGDLPRFVTGDETKLQQVLTNLIGNAIKFTMEGSITLRIEQVESGIRFSVEDTGVGIKEEEMGRLFIPFSQTESGHRLQEGTGLGLALSSQLVRFMGGQLEAHSEAGTGSRFFFTLPLRTAEGVVEVTAGHAGTRLRVVGLEPGQPIRRILIVDDQLSNRLPLRALLDGLNPDPPVLELREAANGREAVAAWDEWQPHLIFMDIRMPVMSGEEATRAITERIASRHDAVQTVVVAITASVFEENQASLLAGGCSEFARKPFRSEEIFEIMERSLGARFIFESSSTAASKPTSGELVEQMAVCPAEWRAALRAAVDVGDFDMIDSLLQQIPEHRAELRKTLADWSYNFDQEAFTDLLDRVA